VVKVVVVVESVLVRTFAAPAREAVCGLTLKAEIGATGEGAVNATGRGWIVTALGVLVIYGLVVYGSESSTA
jgi:hypothetical protein